MSENLTFEQRRTHETGTATGMRSTSRHLLRSMIVAAFLLIVVSVGIAGYLEKWLWMRQLDYTGIFWTLLSVQWAMLCSAVLSLFCTSGSIFARLPKIAAGTAGWINRGALSSFLEPSDTQAGIELSPGLLKAAVVLISAGIALVFATGFYSEWDTYLRFRYGGSFGVSDPLFGVDVGFYVFRLPFYVLLQSSLTLLTIVTLGIVLSIYVFLGLQRASGNGRIAVGVTPPLIFQYFCLFLLPILDGAFTSITTNSSIQLWASSMAPAMRRIM